MHELGLGGPQNLIQAYLWSNRAYNNGALEAGETRDRVAAQMSEAELDEAKRMATER